jgi:hypothetical protein
VITTTWFEAIAMTIIATFIAGDITAHASDSLISVYNGGINKAIEYKKSKIVSVPHFRGAMSYWGLASISSGQRENEWSMYEWLRVRSGEARRYRFPEDFAIDTAKLLNEKLSSYRFSRATDMGVGIHFTAYEYVKGYYIPELFLISNWADPSYTAIRPSGIGVSRETYGTAAGIVDRLPEHREDGFRFFVHEYMKRNGILMYHNGDPLLYNHIFMMMRGVNQVLGQRGILIKAGDWKVLRKMACYPIQVAIEMQKTFCIPGTQLVGGKLHDLVVSAAGTYHSTSGDA